MYSLTEILICTSVMGALFVIAALAAHIGTSDTEDKEWEAYRCKFE